MAQTREKLYRQICDAAGNVLYTYSAHWIIVNRLQSRYTCLKITQIVLIALSTGGFLAILTGSIPNLSWVGGLASALALALNLYSLNFNLPNEIKSHTDAANDLWDVRESYRSLLTDFDDLPLEQIRDRRDDITKLVGGINKKYPGTDKRSFSAAKKKIEKYKFENGESSALFT